MSGYTPTRRAIPPPRDAANRPTLEAMHTAINELSGTLGSHKDRAVRLGELLLAGVLRLTPAGAVERSLLTREDFPRGTIATGDISGLRFGYDGLIASIAGLQAPGEEGVRVSRTGSQAFVAATSLVRIAVGGTNHNFSASGLDTRELLLNSGPRLGDSGPGDQLVLTTAAGTLTLGPGSASFCHYLTNASAHYFDREVAINGVTRPYTDNVRTLGTAGQRWSQLFAGTATISTSDAREKSAIEPLSETEVAAACDMAEHIGMYQWSEAIAAKGAGGARWHCGLTVQQAMAVLAAHGLEPTRYGFICHDAWGETTTELRAAQRDPDTGEQLVPAETVVTPAGDRWGFRGEELLLFLARGFHARLQALEARVDTHVNTH